MSRGFSENFKGVGSLSQRPDFSIYKVVKIFDHILFPCHCEALLRAVAISNRRIYIYFPMT